MEQVKPFSAITDTQIQDWKAKYGKLSQITVGEGDDETNFIVKQPNRMVMDVIADKNEKGDVAGGNNVIIANCVLGGDLEQMESDGGIYSSLLEQIVSLIKRRTATIKNI